MSEIDLNKIEGASLSVQIDGKLYVVALDQNYSGLFLGMAAGFCEGEKLKLIEAPPGMKFEKLSDHLR